MAFGMTAAGKVEAQCEQLSDDDSFVLCDARVSGCPIRHASKGFKDMFCYAEEEAPACIDKLGGCSGITGSEAGVAAAGRAAGLSAQEVVQALQLLEDTAAEHCRRAASGGGAGKATSVMLVKARRGGDMFVCLLSLVLHRHPATGWSFLVGLHKDVTECVSVREMLQAAAQESVQAVLAGLHSQIGCQQALLMHPSSVSYLHEAFDKTCRGFLWGLAQGMRAQRGATGPRGGGGGAEGKQQPSVGGKAGKQKTARSQASAATTASQVTVRRRRSAGDAAVAQSEFASFAEACASAAAAESEMMDVCESPLSAHLLELLEAAEEGCRPAAASEQLPGLHDLEGKKELRDLDFPLAIFDPSQPGLPAVLCSAGLANLLDCPAPEGKIEGLALHAMLESLEEAEECGAFCEAAMQGEYYSSGPCDPGLAKLGPGRGQRLPEGELVCAEASVRRSGEPQECMVYLKQVELDERMYIMCLQAQLPEEAEIAATAREVGLIFTGQGASASPEDRRWLAFLSLAERMDVLIQALAAHFWYSAPMRRQTACVCTEDDF